MPEPFAVKDCALIAISTGRHARNLRELSMHLQDVHIGAIYHHFWGGRMSASFDEPEYQNDFAGWVRHAIHDDELAERLGILDPTNFPDLEELRTEILNLIDERVSNTHHMSWAQADMPFSFNRSQIVILDTHLRIQRPEEFRRYVPEFAAGTVFYHFIDSRRRPPHGEDDFRAWLGEWGPDYDGLRARLSEIDPYFKSLTELKERLVEVFNELLPAREEVGDARHTG